MKVLLVLLVVFLSTKLALSSPMELAGKPGTAGRQSTKSPEEGDDDNNFEGDMRLTQQQREIIDEAVRAGRRDGDRARRKATPNLIFRWPLPIPFEIQSSSEPDRNIILAALQHWEDHTCLTFHEDSTPSSRLSFFKGSGCWSYVGKRTNAQLNLVSIGTGCNSLGIIVHEVGHAIGFFHEQSRPDRDDHVQVLEENIESGTESNFEKYTTLLTEGVPYDTSSVMHYGSDFFSSNGEPTIITLDPHLMETMGNREGLTFYDAKLANLIYECAQDCSSPPSCQNNGFVKSDCTCVCPPEYTGTLCENPNPDYEPPCRIDITIVDGLTGTISSPNYPSDYSANEICSYLITAPAGWTITLSLTFFDLACGDYVGIYPDVVTHGQTYGCGTGSISETSTTNQLRVVFESDSSTQAGGFSATYTMNDLNPPTTQAISTTATSMQPTTNQATTTSSTSMQPTTAEAISTTATSMQPTTNQATTTSSTSMQPTTAEATTTGSSSMQPTTAEATTTGSSSVQPTTAEATTTSMQPAITTTMQSTTETPTTPQVQGTCNVSFSGSSGIFTSPGYPDDYMCDAFCTYNINVPAGQRVALSFDDVSLPGRRDGIEVYLSNASGLPLSLFNRATPSNEIISLSNTMTVVFKSERCFAGLDESGEYGDENGNGYTTGFSASYRAVEVSDPDTANPPSQTRRRVCPGTVPDDDTSRYLQSQNYPQNYPRRSRRCRFRIEAPQGSHVALEFEELFHIYETTNCGWDYLEIDLGRGISCDVRLCGEHAPPGLSFVSLDNVMSLVFRTRRGGNGVGFKTFYHTVNVTPA